ncbi:MAG: prepilin-type N-terminal cleavage/methylation domain-containing protein [Rhodocyclaceae bacterium]|nr:prepilin-type N-terminal cleavage/methylation domain-containing protein [Rhodocyclaceae bacterium]
MMLPTAVLPAPTWRNAGFSLVELAVVMFIISLLIGGMVMPLSAQQDLRALAETDKAVRAARDALLGFAMVHGRLPCPATATSNGVESPQGGGTCTNPHDGLLPAVTLGLRSEASDGYAYDGWGQAATNRLRYATTAVASPGFTTVDGPKNFKNQYGLGTSFAGDLVICSSATGITASSCSGTPTTLASNAVAIIFSLGKNGTTTASAEEAANLNSPADRVFVSAPRSTTFDDTFEWISAPLLVPALTDGGHLKSTSGS